VIARAWHALTAMLILAALIVQCAIAVRASGTPPGHAIGTLAGAQLGWLLFGPRPRIERATIAWSLIWPVLWFGYTLAHGAVSDWYPYPFVSVTEHAYGKVLLNALAVTAVLGAVAAAFAVGAAKLPTPSRANDRDLATS
jgi:hypothetical protein